MVLAVFAAPVAGIQVSYLPHYNIHVNILGVQELLPQRKKRTREAEQLPSPLNSPQVPTDTLYHQSSRPGGMAYSSAGKSYDV